MMHSLFGKTAQLVQARTSRSEPWAPAYLLEAKRFVPATASAATTTTTSTTAGGGESSDVDDIWCFVVWRDRDRKMATWVPTANVDTDMTGEGGQVQSPMVSRIASTRIPLVKRQAAPSVMAFLEERLGRDMRSPTCIRMFHYAGYIFQPWYYSPYGLLYPDFSPDLDVIRDCYLCPFTLKAFPTREQLHHETRCYTASRLSPPGVEIYRDNAQGISVLEVDGAAHRTFCRNLFLICKSFLENKLAGHDVDLYVFYVLCVHGKKHAPDYCNDDSAQLFAGFYSLEKGVDEYNLACIMTMPCFQGFGLGNFLIALSYENAYRRRSIGTPERPLSDLGAAAYERYWWTVIARYLHKKVESQWAAAAESEAGTSAHHNNNTSNNSNNNAVNAVAAGQHPGATAAAGTSPTLEVTVHEIAKRVRLQESDVLETMLKKGLIHRTERKELKIVVPVALVKKIDDDFKNSRHVRFEADKLQR